MAPVWGSEVGAAGSQLSGSNPVGHVMATVVGVISPGAMGSAMGAAYAAAGRRVVTTVEDRSPRTIRLAGAARLELLSGIDDVVATADIVLSVVPPGEARTVSAAIAAAASRTGASPLVADLNAISPASARELAIALSAAGLDLVDGSISGPPPQRAGTTRLYLSGSRAMEVAELSSALLDVRVLGDEVGTASALKMCTASVYKGTVALLAHALLTANEHGVVDAVLDDLSSSYPQLVDRAGVTLARAAAKSARYVPEMQEIAGTQAAAGLPGELFAGMEAAYRSLARTPLAERAPEETGDDPLAEVLARLAPAR
jgi:3-hydroxyisobutyrate dehydrogenase-like beta-hydroxyacid dehydrogenase